MYFYVDNDYEQAFRLYHEALAQGVEGAAYKIGQMYYYGLGTDQDYNKALEYLKYYEGDIDPEDFDANYRFLVCGNYAAFYRLEGNEVKIVRILYGRRNYMQILFGELQGQ